MAKPFVNSFCNISHVGSVNRTTRFKTTRKDDLYFSTFSVLKTGKTPKERWLDYELAHPNASALMPSIVKYDKPTFSVNEGAWRLAESWCVRHFEAACQSHELYADEKVFDLMEKKSSPGYPYVLFKDEKNHSSKRVVLENPELVAQVLKYDSDIALHQCPTFWAVHEKEEIRSHLKILVNRIRTFVGGSLELLYTCMVMFSDMNDKLYASAARGENWSFVGATKFGGGWNDLYRRLDKHPYAYELDEEDYDCSLSAYMLESDARKRTMFLERASPRQIEKIWNIYWEIIYSFMVLPDGDVILKERGNPSGSFNTITDNILTLYDLLAYAWIHLAPPELCSYRCFHANVEAIFCGDDNTWTVSELAHSFFNARSVASIWTALGITTKSDCWEPRKLIDCWFMSSGFLEIEHPWKTGVKVIVPYPETSKVMASLAFNTKCSNARWSLLRSCALRIDSFYNEACRVMIEEYIHYLLQTHMAELKTELDPTDPLDFLTYEEVFSVYKTDYEIISLYHGLEGGFVFSDKVEQALILEGYRFKSTKPNK